MSVLVFIRGADIDTSGQSMTAGLLEDMIYPGFTVIGGMDISRCDGLAPIWFGTFPPAITCAFCAVANFGIQED